MRTTERQLQTIQPRWPGLLSQLAVTRREILPSSVNKPWAGSNRYKISELMSFTAGRPLPVDSPSRPFWVRFKIRLRLTPYTHPATLDTGPLAKSYPRGSLTRLSSKHFQSARASLCSAALLGFGNPDPKQLPDGSYSRSGSSTSLSAVIV